MDQPTVYLIDDDKAVREALSYSLTQAGLNVIPFSTAEAFLDYCHPDLAGCVVLDVRMPDMSGLELQKILNARRIPLPIIFITGHGNVPMSVQALKAGALDFLEKPFATNVLLERIQEALALDRRQRDEHAVMATVCDRYSRLTPREREVMNLVVKGKTNKEIAKELAISYRTVEKHRAWLMERMGAQNLADLCAMATLCGDKPSNPLSNLMSLRFPGP